MKGPLVINGFMATGKSSVARLVARRCDVPLLDLDREIAQREGQSIPDIFANRGESHFRQLEENTLRELLQRSGPRVIAVGGGALLRRSLRTYVMSRAVLVSLTADLSIIAQRVRKNEGSRPLLARADDAQIERLMELRAPAYAEAHEVIDSGTRTLQQTAEQVEAVWHRDPVGVAAGTDSYSVEIGAEIVKTRLSPQLQDASLGFLISDQTVHGLHGLITETAMRNGTPRFAKHLLVPGEEHKNSSSLSQIWEAALEANADRKTLFVGLGGGVATDVTGFAAATWMRGVSWVSMPTTLLGMVDASVGGKTAVDLPLAKNCVGAFWQPKRVLCDIAHLRTESDRGFRSGLAEVVKTALIGDADLFDLLEREASQLGARNYDLVEEVVRRCIRVKARVVSQDEREGSVRACLNLGHTVGHAIEATGGYGGLTHGESVSLGLVAALRLGARRGITPNGLSERTIHLLDAIGLPVDLCAQPLAKATELLGNDKKRAGDSVKFVFTSEPGEYHFEEIGISELKAEVLGLCDNRAH